VVPPDSSTWLRICRLPNRPIEGVSLGDFRVGGIIELGPQLAGLFMAEGWAKPVFVRREGDVGASTPDRLLLVVDDDPATRSLLVDLFNSCGYAVVVAENGADALRQLVDYTPDLVVLDLQMPVLDGFGFRAAQRTLSNFRTANVPVLALTGTRNAARSAETLSAAGFVEKPFEPDQLVEAVLKALSSRAPFAAVDRRVRS
jgi:two-component system, chemotaxis family, chemotaxis protein CheY